MANQGLKPGHNHGHGEYQWITRRQPYEFKPVKTLSIVVLLRTVSQATPASPERDPDAIPSDYPLPPPDGVQTGRRHATQALITRSASTTRFLTSNAWSIPSSGSLFTWIIA